MSCDTRQIARKVVELMWQDNPDLQYRVTNVAPVTTQDCYQNADYYVTPTPPSHVASACNLYPRRCAADEHDSDFTEPTWSKTVPEKSVTLTEM